MNGIYEIQKRTLGSKAFEASNGYGTFMDDEGKHTYPLGVIGYAWGQKISDETEAADLVLRSKQLNYESH